MVGKINLEKLKSVVRSVRVRALVERPRFARPYGSRKADDDEDEGDPLTNTFPKQRTFVRFAALGEEDALKAPHDAEVEAEDIVRHSENPQASNPNGRPKPGKRVRKWGVRP